MVGKYSEENLKGRVFSNLKVMEFSYKEKNKKFYKCKCLLCGKTKEINIYNVVSGATKSCGCQRGESKMLNYINYIEQKKEKVIELEDELSKIKNDPQWILARNYLNSMQQRGLIDEAPTKSNRYKKPEILA